MDNFFKATILKKPGEFMGPFRSGSDLTSEEVLERVVELRSIYLLLEQEKVRLRLLNTEIEEKLGLSSGPKMWSEELIDLKQEIECITKRVRELENKFNFKKTCLCNHDLVMQIDTDYDGDEGRSYEEIICLGCLGYTEKRRGSFKNIISRTDSNNIVVPWYDRSNAQTIERRIGDTPYGPAFFTPLLSEQYIELLFKYTSYYLNKKDSEVIYRPDLVAKVLYNRWVNKGQKREDYKPFVLRSSKGVR